MQLAWKEMRHNWKKYLLVEVIVILMMFMVIFLSGLVKGLGRAVSSSVDNMPADRFILSDDSEKILTVSNLTPDEYTAVQNKYKDKATPIDVQRTYLQKGNKGDKQDVTYFAIDPDGFLSPKVTQGKKLTTEKNTIVLDDDFESTGIEVGDTIEDSASKIKLKVVGFTQDAMYGHIAAAYMSTDTYRAIMKAANPAFQNTVHGAALKGKDRGAIAGTKVYTKAAVIKAIPGYQAEQMTITMVEWLLVAITAMIIGTFFFVINLQKEKEYGVLKAIGVPMRRLVGMILCQVITIAASGALIAAALTAGMSAALPVTMPFFLEAQQVALVLCAFVAISVLGSLATVARVGKIDPARIIGGDFQ